MKVLVNKRFLKDLAKLPASERKKIETFVFEQSATIESIGSVGGFEKLKGYHHSIACALAITGLELPMKMTPWSLSAYCIEKKYIGFSPRHPGVIVEPVVMNPRLSRTGTSSNK